MQKLVDKVGNEIKPGQYIVYGHLLGRCAGLRIGKVLAAGWKKDSWDDSEMVARITVWGIEDGWSHQRPKLCRSRGTLQFPERVLVLQDAQIPEVCRTLLEPVTLETKRKQWSSDDV